MKRKREECFDQFYRNNQKNRIITLTCVVLTTMMWVGMAVVFKYFIESIEHSDENILKRAVTITMVAIAAFFIISILLRKYKNRYLMKALSQFKDYVFRKLLDKSISEFRHESGARFISAFSNDLNSIEQNYLAGSIQLFDVVVSFFIASAAMIYFNWKLGLPTIIASIICIILSIKYGEALIEKETQTSDSNREFVAQVNDLVSGFIVIKSFRAEKEALDLFQHDNLELESVKRKRRVTSDTISLYSNISTFLVNGIIIGGGFLYAINGEMTIGAVIAFVQLGFYLYDPVRKLAPLISNRKAAIKLVEKIAREIEGDGIDRSDEDKLLGINEGIHFQEVGFKYSEEDEAVHDFNFFFEKGKRYAIAGGSGSGKSTVLKLMLGYFRGYTGSIKIDSLELRNIQLDSLFEHLSVIQQEVFLFNSSLKNNITMFQEVDEVVFWDAVKNSGLEKLIENKGLDYPCGENGKNLSGGEKQRVAIARSLIRKTPFLLMDESTAALDNKTAEEVESAVIQLDDITKIVVTHRLNRKILRMYDEILVMNHARLVEHGSFDDLIHRKGYFYSLYNVMGE